MSEDIKLCKDCKYYWQHPIPVRWLIGPKYSKCMKTINPGTGEPTSTCEVERDSTYDSLNSTCGSMGRFFARKGK